MASRLATLDDDPGVRPDAHALIFDKAPWFVVTDDLPQYPARIPGQNLPTINLRSDVGSFRLAVRGHVEKSLSLFLVLIE
jgi:hypothetical protein